MSDDGVTHPPIAHNPQLEVDPKPQVEGDGKPPIDPQQDRSAWVPSMTDGHPRCQAKSSWNSREQGRAIQCGRRAAVGQRVCASHGGSTTHAKQRAALRLAGLIDPAIKVLEAEMIEADASRDRQNAANSILDRAGVPRSTTTPDGDAARDLLLDRLATLRRERGVAVVVDDGPVDLTDLEDPEPGDEQE